MTKDLQTRIRKERNLFDYNPDIFPFLRGFERIGLFTGKSSRELSKSALSIGFETLDRDTFNPADTYDLLAESGVKHARLQTGWIKCEKKRGVYDFSWLDPQVENLLRRGIKPWFNCTFGNPLYTPVTKFEEIIRNSPPGQAPARIRGYCGETPIYFGEEGMAGWCAYLDALVRHYQGTVDEFEIWNEPFGIGEFWRQNGEMPYPDLDPVSRFRKCAADYAEMVRRSALAIHGANPEAKVIANTALDSRYTDELIRNGILSSIDVLSYHLYPLHEKETVGKVRHIRKILDLAGGSHIPLWQGESGFPTAHAENFSVPSEYVQAKYIAKRILMDVRCGARLSSIFTVTDFLRYYADGSSQHFGIIDAAKKQPKLGFYALQSLAGFLEDLTFAPELLCVFTSMNGKANFDTMSFDTQLLGFRHKGVPVFAVWQEGKVDLSHSAVLGELSFFLAPEEHFRNPVVFDPIRQNLWRAEDAHTSGWSGGALTINPFPMIDYPQLITDESLFSDMKKTL